MELPREEFQIVPYDFGKKCFPCRVNGKLNTLEFLEASKGVVKLIEKMGKVFSPLSSDVSGNIEKIKKCYVKNPSKYAYIEDLILCEKSENNELAIDALLWLRREEYELVKEWEEMQKYLRALHFILIFFQNILNDSMKNECLQEHMSSAYSQALEPYHGWVTRKLFGFFKSMVPNRTTLLSTITADEREDAKENLIKFLTFYIQALAENVNHIASFYNEHNLDSAAKV